MTRGATLGLWIAVTSIGCPVICAGQENAVDLAPYQRGLQFADNSLNQTYQQVMATLDPVTRTSLKTTQRSWIIFKEADFAIAGRLTQAAGDETAFYDYQTAEENSQAEALRDLGKPDATTEARFRREVVATSQRADQLLNDLYHQMMAVMPPEMSVPEKSAQASWIRFRDLYCQLDASMKGGTGDDAVLRDLTLRRTAQLGRCIQLLIEIKLPVPAGSGNPTDDAEETPTDPPPADPFRFAK